MQDAPCHDDHTQQYDTSMKLLLFDIDGTLLHTDGTGRAAVERALEDVVGRPVTTDGVSFSGKTDPQIMREILSANGFDASEANDLTGDVLAAYAGEAMRLLAPERVTVLPGVRPLLERLAATDGVHLALLTGNLQRTGFGKLQAAGLDAFFRFGAFGSDHADRYELPAVAVRRAREQTGRTFAGRDVVIIGDTEHDVGCGRGIGAFSVAVCTGRYGRADLAPHDPDVLLDDLSDADAFFERVVRV